MTTPNPFRVARQHMQHGLAKRRSKMYYLHNRNQIKLRAKRRYRRVHNTGAFRHTQLHRLRHPGLHHRIHASTAPVVVGLPFWSPLFGEGMITEIVGANVTFHYCCDNSAEHTCFYEDFLEEAVFLSEKDLTDFFCALDNHFGLDKSFTLDGLV